MTTIGDKWSIYLLVSLAKAPNNRARFSELERTIPAISQKVLSSSLKKLESDGLIIREVFPEVPPRVEYEITSMGLSLYTLMEGLVDWVTINWENVKKSQAKYNSSHSKSP